MVKVLDDFWTWVMSAIETTFDFFLDNIDLIASLSCIVAAFVCAALMFVVLRERAPLVDLQRFSLGVLAVALFANGVTYYPEWQLVDGHRLTGAYLNVAILVNGIIMLIRGGIIMQNGDKYGRRPSSRISNN